MVKIKGICRALGRVIERALRSEVSGDADETHQRQRSIASVHRQRAATLVAEDVEHVDHAADEVHDQPQEAVVDVQGFPGRPHNTLVLMDYIHHVVVMVWNGEIFFKKIHNIFITIFYSS